MQSVLLRCASHDARDMPDRIRCSKNAIDEPYPVVLQSTLYSLQAEALPFASLLPTHRFLQS